MTRSLNRAARLRDIENLLFRKPAGMRVPEIASHCGVNRRTIYRDIELLTDAGVPIWQDGGLYGIVREKYLVPVRLNYNEAVILYIASRLLTKHADEHNPHIVSSLNKLLTAFPDPLFQHMTIIAESSQHKASDRNFINILETVVSCWMDKNIIKFWYRSPRSGNIHERDFCTYVIEPSIYGGLYIIGFDKTINEMRTFKLERLEKAIRIDRTYEIPTSFDLTNFLRDAWGIMGSGTATPVKLLFSASAAPYISERIWHRSQQTTEQTDGSLLVEFLISDPREMKPWIRSWGREVEVLTPQWLRDEIAEEAAKLATIYKR